MLGCCLTSPGGPTIDRSTGSKTSPLSMPRTMSAVNTTKKYLQIHIKRHSNIWFSCGYGHMLRTYANGTVLLEQSHTVYVAWNYTGKKIKHYILIYLVLS